MMDDKLFLEKIDAETRAHGGLTDCAMSPAHWASGTRPSLAKS